MVFYSVKGRVRPTEPILGASWVRPQDDNTPRLLRRHPSYKRGLYTNGHSIKEV
jgi:hypothetical protein